MILNTPGWLGASLRAIQAARDVGWWLGLSVDEALREAIAEEAHRLSVQAATLANGGKR